MPAVKAKFKCHKVTEFESSKEVSLTPNFQGNEDFTKYTPSGELRMIITPETAAYQYFQPGKVYSMLIQEEEKA